MPLPIAVMAAVLWLLVRGSRAVYSICQAAAAVGSRASEVFRLSNVPCLPAILVTSYGEIARRSDVRHIREGVGTNFVR